MSRRSLGALIASLLLALVHTSTLSQAFPSRPLRIVVAGVPGGPGDEGARLVAVRMSETLGQPVVVDNRPGGSAQIAAAQVLQAPADGHTLFVGDIGAFAINGALHANLSFDPTKDFLPISTLMSSPMVLLVPAASTLNSVDELVARARAPMGRLTFASAGVGTGSHLIAEMLKMRSGARLAHVPYNGFPAAIQALMAGDADLLFQVLGAALPLAKAGKVRMLAVTSPTRSAIAPEVPTTAELGYPDLGLEPWFGIAARAGTPEAAMVRLHREVIAALKHPETVKRLTDAGFEPRPTSPEDFRDFIRAESTRWGRVVRASGARRD